MRELELLAPARNADIGIAAIDCGADAVYIAGPEFGARQAAGNEMAEIRRLCEYAHLYGARIYLTLNTILYDNELEAAEKLLKEAEKAGVDAIIAQDPAVWQLTDLPVHASTQCSIRTPETASFYEHLGAARLVLERELSLDQIREIRKSVGCELEFFVHGALCVCYSGQCYLSERISSRSANRGACIQACRSLYDLVDGNGNVLVKDKALLSLKDLNLRARLSDLAEAGICSFKIEGRLKNASYVMNTVRAYSIALDNLVARCPETYRRASSGICEGGFSPDLDKTFNRGYTKLFLDGTRGQWSSMDAPKSMGEEIGTVASVTLLPERDSVHPSGMQVIVNLKNPADQLHNGDGFSFTGGGHNEIIGFRGDLCQGSTIICRRIPQLKPGTRLWRNLDSAFEKELENNIPVRRIPVSVGIAILERINERWLIVKALSQDGRLVGFERHAGSETASNPSRMKAMFESQICKSAGIYSFSLESLNVKTSGGKMPFLPASALNGIRRDIAEELEKTSCKAIPLGNIAGRPTDGKGGPSEATYKHNVSNRISREIYRGHGAKNIEDAFEISHKAGAELMRTKYCIRYELGLCPTHQKARPTGPLFLVNNGRRYSLAFDCTRCEMTVSYAH